MLEFIMQNPGWGLGYLLVGGILVVALVDSIAGIFKKEKISDRQNNGDN